MFFFFCLLLNIGLVVIKWTDILFRTDIVEEKHVLTLVFEPFAALLIHVMIAVRVCCHSLSQDKVWPLAV